MKHLSWPFFEDRHRGLAEGIREWAGQNLGEAPAHEDPGAECRRLAGLLAEGGWLKYAVPSSDGRLDIRSLCLIREVLAGRDALADLVFAMQGLGSGTISLFGSRAQKDEYLAGVSEGRRISAFALSEPQAGSDVAALTTSYRQEGDELVLSGTKTWITNAGIADTYLLFARRQGSSGSTGISAILVDAPRPGLSVEPIRMMAPHPMGRVELSECRVPRTALVGAEGKGFSQALATLDLFRPTVGAAAAGLAARASRVAIERARGRQLFGAPMSELQLIQSKIARMALHLDAARLLIYRAAWAADSSPGRITGEAAMAKLFATETAQKIIDDAVQIFGAQGVVSGHTVERLYREIRALRIYEGASEVQEIVIAREALKD